MCIEQSDAVSIVRVCWYRVWQETATFYQALAQHMLVTLPS